MEHYYQTLFAYIEAVIPLPAADKAAIRQSFQPVFAPKDTIIEAAGQIPRFHNFIVSGYMRNFSLDENNQEITTDLNEGCRFFTSYYHFMNQTVSNDNLHCITDCELLRISREEVEQRAVLSSTQKEFTIRILQHHLQQDKIRISDMINLTAEARYRKFLSDKPAVSRHVPLRYIASYLGITQRHLSRLRRICND